MICDEEEAEFFFFTISSKSIEAITAIREELGLFCVVFVAKVARPKK